ncbi:MAG TPA: siderophore-interacting protein [Caulobacteraceae bacterium]|nr:siderophore-interacting protein [Caulobacteraceae bacterium]
MNQAFPLPVRLARQAWPLVVVGSRELTPAMRRVSLVGETLAGFDYRPGQDLVLSLPSLAGVARRHYTIRGFDREELRLDVDVLVHGAGPGSRWAETAKIGDPVLAEGPRGRTFVNQRADWHLFTGDETALPGIAAMIETLPSRAQAFAIIEVEGREEEQPLPSQARLEAFWLHRRGSAAPSVALIDALSAFQFPAGVGQAYVIGETSTVRAQRQGLIARGFPKEQICAEGYWRPGRIGGHDHVEPFEERARDRVRRWVS